MGKIIPFPRLVQAPPKHRMYHEVECSFCGALAGLIEEDIRKVPRQLQCPRCQSIVPVVITRGEVG